MDADTTYSRYAYEENFSKFEAGEYDIMIGTQMVAKGLNFPNVTLVGVLGADQYLYSGDFRSGEKTFSLITQVVGRSGRYEKPGAAYIQTISPEHPVIQDAARQDYEAFYADEIMMRKTALQPPFCDLAVIGLAGTDEEAVRQAANGLHSILARALTDAVPQLPAVLLGVSEAGVYRMNGRFRLRIILKCKNNRRFRSLLRAAIAEADRNRLFSKASIYVDMNGDIG
jgi:primosomal protein N' (replication factor Y)